MKIHFIIVFASMLLPQETVKACETTLAYLDKVLPHYTGGYWFNPPWIWEWELSDDSSGPLINDYIRMGPEAARNDVISTDVGKLLRELKSKGIKPSAKIQELLKEEKLLKTKLDQYGALASDTKINFQWTEADPALELSGPQVVYDINHNIGVAIPGHYGAGYGIYRLRYIKCKETIIQLACLASTQ